MPDMRICLYRGVMLTLSLTLASCASSSQRDEDMRVADVALKTGSPAPALEIARRHLNANPNDVAALDIQGDAEYATGRMAQADASYARALALAPHDRRALLGIGRLMLMYDPKQAQDYFRRVVTYYPNDLTGWTNLGVAYDALGQHLSAQKLYRRVIAHNPEEQAAVINLGLSLTLSGHYQEALQYLLPLVRDRHASARERSVTAMALVAAGRERDATILLGTYLSPNNVRLAMAFYRKTLNDRSQEKGTNDQ